MLLAQDNTINLKNYANILNVKIPAKKQDIDLYKCTNILCLFMKNLPKINGDELFTSETINYMRIYDYSC